MTDSPGVTVVVPTLNRGQFLIDTVNDLIAQDYRPLEILLVDQSESTDPHLESLVREHADLITYYRVSFRGLPIARNFGWQMARHDLIVYVDDDIRCGNSLVEEHVRLFQDETVGLTAGGIDEASSPTPPVTATGTYNRWTASATRGFHAHGVCDVQHVPGGNFGARRSVLAEHGGIDEHLGMASALLEETDFAMRVAKVGARLRFNGAARLTHLVAGAGGTRQRDMRRYVYGLSHNRSVMIRRHSRWYQWPVALGYSAKLILAYAVHYREIRLLVTGGQGMMAGWQIGGFPPLCTDFRETCR